MVSRIQQERISSSKWIGAILFACLIYPAILCFIHTHYHPVTPTTVGFTEFFILLICFFVLTKSDFLKFISVIFWVAAVLLFLSVFRNVVAVKPPRFDMVLSFVEIKTLRDVMIPIFFYWLGRSTGDIKTADRILMGMVITVLVFVAFEFFFVDAYAYLWNIKSYYFSMEDRISWREVIGFSLNGERPEDVGRSILPGILDRHRISSIFLEPISLGNFAVIAAAWGLSKGKEDFYWTVFFVLSAITLAILGDSRYAMMAILLLVCVRFVLWRRLNIFMSISPILAILGLFYMVPFSDDQSKEDIIRRLSTAGQNLHDCNPLMLLGLAPILDTFRDEGYAYIFSRCGLLLCLFLWFGFWKIKMQDRRGESFRAYIAVHISLILCVSGTSLFALKSAGILWFLIGCCSCYRPRSELCQLK